MFHIVAMGEDSVTYWLHLAVSRDATLKDLDAALRILWLECCGHMSVFQVDGRQVGSSRMRIPVGDLLEVGSRFIHEYDMGSTTTLFLEVLDCWPGTPTAAADRVTAPPKRRSSSRNPKGIVLLARNDAPQFTCIECQQPARHVCVECVCEGGAWLCDDCLDSHNCGAEMALPIVNSPRVGVCGYTGE